MRIGGAFRPLEGQTAIHNLTNILGATAAAMTTSGGSMSAAGAASQPACVLLARPA